MIFIDFFFLLLLFVLFCSRVSERPEWEMRCLQMSFLHRVFLSTGTTPCHPVAATSVSPECRAGTPHHSTLILPPSLSLPVFLSRQPSFLSTFPAQLLCSCQQIWTSDTGVPATRGETTKVIPARTFSSSQLSWQRGAWAKENEEVLTA